jgi:hypothetical protein
MRLPRSLIWIPLALGAAIVAASAPSQAQIVVEPAPTPAPYNYYGPDPYYGPRITDGPGSCYEDNLMGRVCRD